MAERARRIPRPPFDPAAERLSALTGPLDVEPDATRGVVRLAAPGLVELVGEQTGPVALTEEAAHVWGVDRGRGEALPDVAPPGADGAFDALVLLYGDGTGLVIDRVHGGPRPIAPHAVWVGGGRIGVMLSERELPSRGLAFADYRYALWPRRAALGLSRIAATPRRAHLRLV